MTTFENICLSLIITSLIFFGGYKLVMAGYKSAKSVYTSYCVTNVLHEIKPCEELTLKIFERADWVELQAEKQGLYK